MATQQQTVDFIIEQVSTAGVIRSRKLFGEYALYCNEKVVAFICDDQLFIKPTHAGRSFISTPHEAAPYRGAKLYFQIPQERWDDYEWLTQLVRITADTRPMPQSKRTKRT